VTCPKFDAVREPVMAFPNAGSGVPTATKLYSFIAQGDSAARRLFDDVNDVFDGVGHAIAAETIE
jgi:hypothetical protein